MNKHCEYLLVNYSIILNSITKQLNRRQFFYRSYFGQREITTNKVNPRRSRDFFIKNKARKRSQNTI